MKPSLQAAWPTLRQLVSGSAYDVVIASVNDDGSPHITPIGSLFLRDDCTGYYEGNRSRVRLKGSPSGLFVGIWIEPFTIRSCDATVEKSPHWGRVVLRFDESASSWTGEWGYCDDEPSNEWVGSR